ncbi:MAG: cytochrome c [Deltaproteobacteria bacterium]|nr:cytochrome c [Deltaproteobacteria bacterium]
MRTLLTLALFSTLALACGGEEASGGNAAGGSATEAPEAPAADISLPGDAAAGEAIYTANCLACHGADGTGNGGMTGGNFIGEPERLQKGNDVLLGEIANGINRNGKVMPAWKDTLTEQERKDALSYIRHHFGHQG